MPKTNLKPKARAGSLERMVRGAGLKWSRASIAYNADCNTRRLKRPDEKRKQLRAATVKAFNELMGILKGSAPNEQS